MLGAGQRHLTNHHHHHQAKATENSRAPHPPNRHRKPADAPALKRADVGIAVQGATDAARAAADMVLTREGLSVIVHAIVVARCIFARMKNFINYR